MRYRGLNSEYPFLYKIVFIWLKMFPNPKNIHFFVKAPRGVNGCFGIRPSESGYRVELSFLFLTVILGVLWFKRDN